MKTLRKDSKMGHSCTRASKRPSVRNYFFYFRMLFIFRKKWSENFYSN